MEGGKLLVAGVEEYVPKDQVITVNSSAVIWGRRLCCNGRVRERSFVTLGADANTSVRLFTGGKPKVAINAGEIYRQRKGQSFE